MTALRWAGILKSLGNKVNIASDYHGERCDLLLALHARRSAAAILGFRRAYPEKPIVVALTGTDVYRDLPRSRMAQRALEAADRIVALQPLAVTELAPDLRGKCCVIYQSDQPSGRERRTPKSFDVCVAGHLRSVKDPLRTAYAVRLLPEHSRIRVLQAGEGMLPSMEQRALAEQTRNPRYHWMGPLTRARTLRLIARSHILVLSSRMEGGANVISEAIVRGTPVIASRIPGSVGLLGTDYPGYFPFGDSAVLASLLLRAETDSEFYKNLRQHCARLAPRFRPAAERRSWRDLVRELAGIKP